MYLQLTSEWNDFIWEGFHRTISSLSQHICLFLLGIFCMVF
jgi:heme A synthase